MVRKSGAREAPLIAKTRSKVVRSDRPSETEHSVTHIYCDTVIDVPDTTDIDLPIISGTISLDNRLLLSRINLLK